MQSAPMMARAGSTRDTTLENRSVKQKNTLFHKEFEIWSVASWGGWARRGWSHHWWGMCGARRSSLSQEPPAPEGQARSGCRLAMRQVAPAPLTAEGRSSCPRQRPQGQQQGTHEPARAPGGQGRRSSNFTLPGRSITKKEAGHRPVPATHSPREAQKHPALAVQDGELPEHKPAFHTSPASGGRRRRKALPSCQAQDREHGSGRGALSQQRSPWPLLPALQRRCRQLTPHSQSQDSQQSPGKIQGSESQSRMAEKCGTRQRGQGGMTQNQGWGSAGQQPSSVHSLAGKGREHLCLGQAGGRKRSPSTS